MCGIVGYTGKEQAAPILLDGLAKLEYRGYDSAGIAVNTGDRIEVVRAKGHLKVLEEMTDHGRSVSGLSGIGHTRWASHGEPSVINAHPHSNRARTISLVHNGIIENYQDIKAHLERSGYIFESETDTEVIVHLIDYYYHGDPLDAIISAMLRMTGSYALGIIFFDHPDEIYGVRKDSPLIAGINENGGFLASDVPALLKHTRDVYIADDNEIIKIKPDGIRFYNIDRDEVEKEPHRIEWDAEAAEKGGYEHFMLKEIYEQPRAVRDTISPRVKDGELEMSELNMSEEDIKNIREINIIACGSSYHSGICVAPMFEGFANIPTHVELASEYRYRKEVVREGTLAIMISQSGETADSLAALREAKARGVKVLGIVNVVGSSIARESDYVFYTWAGLEIAVATTKAYSAQLAALYLIALYFARVRGQVDDGDYKTLIKELLSLPDKIQTLLGDRERIQWFSSKFAASRDVYFIGRGADMGTSMEGSLKLKEISYIHSEACAAGELKHGLISLIEKGTLVVGIATQPVLYEKTVNNIIECRTRGAYVMGLTTSGNFPIEDVANFTVYLPKTVKWFTPSTAVIPLQMFAYYVALAKGLEVDKPRNLAKSVTIE